MSYTLYRHYNCKGILLYVGVSGKLIKRTKEHTEKVWFKEISHITVQHFNWQKELFDAERKAIYEECPLHNIKCNNTKRHNDIIICRLENNCLKYEILKGGKKWVDLKRQKIFMLRYTIEAVSNGSACPISSTGTRLRKVSRTPFNAILGVERMI